jgi:hypothetical protein
MSADMRATTTSPATRAAVAENRRRGRRHRLDIPAELVPATDMGAAAAIAVRITELSVGGAGLRSPEQLEIGAVYEVRSFDTLIPVDTRIRIISQRKTRDGNDSGGEFDIGAQVL